MMRSVTSPIAALTRRRHNDKPKKPASRRSAGADERIVGRSRYSRRVLVCVALTCAAAPFACGGSDDGDYAPCSEEGLAACVAEGFASCDAALGCIECGTDADCTTPGISVCNVAEVVCDECATDMHCAANTTGHTCLKEYGFCGCNGAADCPAEAPNCIGNVCEVSALGS